MKTNIFAYKNHGKNSVLKTFQNLHQNEGFEAQKPHFGAGFQPLAFAFFWLQKPLSKDVFGHVGGYCASSFKISAAGDIRRC